jgi:SNF2 family DNA or RNA helicase
MKQDHLKGLPEKNIIVQPTTMPPSQAEHYTNIINEAHMNRGEQGAMLKALQHLRNCSLFSSEILEEGLTDTLIAESARTAATIKILDKIYAQKEKGLIFLESLKLQELLIPYLQKRYEMQYPPMRISGKETGLKRKKYVDQFQNGNIDEFDVMILSPKAGGVGLTLTAANHVIHLSRWWNPAVEDQCTDRIFRIGQKKSVFIYYPLAIHPKYKEMSFDQNLHNLLEKKRELSRAVLVPTTVTPDDYKFLYENTIG